MHGALWVQMKTTGAVNQRSAMFAANAWWGVLVLTAIVTTITFKIQSQVKENFVTWPWGLIFPFLAIAGIVGVRFELVKRDERKAFFASCAYLMGMLTSVVFGLYPLVLPARNPVYSLTISSAKAADYGLKIGLGSVGACALGELPTAVLNETTNSPEQTRQFLVLPAPQSLLAENAALIAANTAIPRPDSEPHKNISLDAAVLRI